MATQPIGQQAKAFGRGIAPAAQKISCMLVALAALTTLVALTRPWQSQHMFTSGKNFMIASAVGLGAGLLSGFVPVLGGGRTSYVTKITESFNGMGSGARMITTFASMAAVGILLGYAPAVGGALLWGLLGNHLTHSARDMGAGQVNQPAAADERAPQAHPRMPGRGHRLDTAVIQG